VRSPLTSAMEMAAVLWDALQGARHNRKECRVGQDFVHRQGRLEGIGHVAPAADLALPGQGDQCLEDALDPPRRLLIKADGDGAGSCRADAAGPDL